MLFKQNITKQEINELPIGAFTGNLFVIDTLSALKKAIPLLKSNSVLGFDTETKPSFKKGQIHKVAVLQFANKTTAYIICLNKIGFNNPILDILSDKKIIKVGVAIHDDLLKLKSLNNFIPNNFIDLNEYAKQLGFQNVGLRNLAALILNIRISKTQQLSNWEAEHLNEAQLRYAATDAWACYEIYSVLSKIKDTNSLFL